MKALKIIIAILLLPFFVFVIANVSAIFRGYAKFDDFDLVVAFLITVVLYWLFFTGRLAWVFRKV